MEHEIQKITANLWFDFEAEETARYYFGKKNFAWIHDISIKFGGYYLIKWGRGFEKDV